MKQMYLRFLVLCCLLPFNVYAEVNVVTSIAPVQGIVQSLTKGLKPPKQLLSANNNVHHASLKPSQVRILEQADLVVWVGPSLEQGLTKVISNQQGTSVLRLSELPEITRLPLRGKHDHEEHESGLIGQQQTELMDPHIWLSLANAEVMAEAIAARLIVIDPENKAVYQQNLMRFRAQSVALMNETAHQFASLKQRSFVALHDSFQYFESEYGLSNVVPLNPQGSETMGLRQLEALLTGLKGETHCLITEPHTSARLVKRLSALPDVAQKKVDVLGLENTTKDSDYFSLMRSVSDQFLACLN